MRQRCVAIGLLLASYADAEPPAIGRDTRTAVAVTVYNHDLGLVKDTRRVTLPRGESRVRFEDVASAIDPRTVAVRSVSAPEALAIVEQNYVFDLISPEKLLEKYVGHEVELLEADETLKTQSTPATLLSTNGGPVYRIGDRIAVGHPGRVVLPKLPEALYARPTLLWQLANGGPSEHTIEVSYLTTGLGWEADYVMVLAPDDTRADLTGWVTLTNTSGARYDEATLKLVAGDVHRAPQPMAAEAMDGDVVRMRSMAAPKMVEEAFFDYHLYTLDRPATVAENETKQLRLLAGTGVPVTKRYLVVGQPHWFRTAQGDLEQDVPVGVFIDWRNDEKSHLGMPLPAGVVRLYKQDDSGAQQFVGEDRIKHTPKDERLTLEIGKAFDVVAKRVQTDFRQTSQRPPVFEVAFAITIRNHKPEPVTITVREPVGGTWKVLEASHPSTKLDAGTFEFSLPVPKDGEAVLTYRLQIG